MEPTIKDWINEMKKLINYLGKKNVIISIYENGDSTDNTRKYLLEFESYLIENEIINVVNTQKLVQKEGVDRIVFLSRLRNKSLDFLYYIMDLDFSNTKIIFFNDIIFRYEDIIKLITTNNGNYDTVCAMDYYESFYDTWASIGLDGKQFRRYFPYMYNKEQQDAYINGEIIRTFSCWNGVTVINAKPFEIRDNLFFRFGKKIRQSECTLLHADMYFMGYRKVFVNTQIAVAYTYEYYYKNHYIYPWTKNLITYFYYYFKYGFIRRNYNLTNLVDNDISMDDDLDQVVLEYMGK
jgi:calcineurin-like phosphoesterase family protein